MSIEGEIKSFDVSTQAATPDFPMFDGDSFFATFAYLTANKYQPYVRYTSNEPTVGASSDLTEIGANYIISGHNIRLNLNFTTGDANASGSKGTDSDAITFGMQFQI